MLLDRYFAYFLFNTDSIDAALKSKFWRKAWKFMKKKAGKMISLSLAVALAMTAAPVTVMADENVITSVKTVDAETEKKQDEKTNSNPTPTKEHSDLENGKVADSEKAEGMMSFTNALSTSTVDESAKIGEENVVEVDGTAYTSLQEAIENISDGATVKLLENIALDPPETSEEEVYPLMTIDKNIILDLNGKTISWNEEKHNQEFPYTPVFFAIDNAEVTIINDGMIDTDLGENNSYGINIIRGGALVIEDGTFTGSTTAVQVQTGTLKIYGGTFKQGKTISEMAPEYSKYVINCADKNWKDGTGKLEIYGGTFCYDFSNNPEGPGTSYVAEGYKSVANADGTYTVQEIIVEVDTFDELQNAVNDPQYSGGRIIITKDISMEDKLVVNNKVRLEGGSDVTLTGELQLKNGSLKNLTLTNDPGKAILSIGSTEKNTIKMDGVTVKYPVTGTSAGTVSVLSGNNADITITDCTFMNEADNDVTENASEWSYGIYMNNQGTGSFTFTKSRFDGAFRTMLANINGTVSITDNEFVNSIYSNNSGSTSGSGEEATCITTAKADVNNFTITGNIFDNAGAFYFQKTIGATVTGNTFKSDKFEHYVQVSGGAANPLDLTENTFEMGENDLVIIDVAAAPVILPVGQKAVNYWAWANTDASVRPEDYSSYVYAYNEDGSVTFYPGTQAAMDAFLEPATGNIGMTMEDTLYVEGELELKQNITEGQLVVSGNGQLNVSEGVEIADDALAMEPGAKVTGLKKDISDSIEVPDGYKLVVTKDENGEYTYTLQKKSSGGSSHRYDGYITIINPKNGTVSVSDDWADEDQKITLTITPDKGYVVDKIEIVDAEGDKIDAKKVEDKDDKYTFRMANCDVTVTVTFKEEGKTEDKEETTTEETETEETTKPETITFSDVKESDWFYKGVSYVVENSMMNGVGDNQFAPNAPLTREMLAVVLYNMEKQPESTGVNPFADVKADMWYTDAIVWANANGIVAGYDDSTFGLGDSITREQLATILYRYAQLKGYDVTEKADLTGYTDSTAISGYAVEAMQWANANGIVNGMTETTLAPQGTATRAQVATMLMNFCENVATKAE